MRTTAARFVAAAATLALASLAPADPLGVSELAPKETIFLAGTNDYAAAREAFRNTGFHSLLEEPAVRDWVDRLLHDRPAWFDETLEELGLELGDINHPTGRAGAAVWRGADPDTAAPRLEFLVAADFGDGADQIEDVALAMIERGEDDDVLEVWTEEYNVTIVHVFERIPSDPAEAPLDPDELDAFEGFDEVDEQDRPDRLHFARWRDWALLTTTMGAMQRTLDLLDGADFDVAADRPEFARALDLAPPRHFGAAVFMRPLIDAVLAFRDDGGAGMPNGDIRIVLEALGISAVDSFSVGGAFDGPHGMLEIEHGLATRGKPGLLSLMDVEPMLFHPPPFLPAGADYVNATRLGFDQILPMLNQALADMPEAVRQQLQPTVAMLSASAGPLLQAIGPDAHFTRDIARPFALDNVRSLTALQVRDPDAVSQSIVQLGGLVGLQERDFEGVRLWEMGGAEGFAAAVHAGHLLIGRTRVVEDAVRRAGDRGGAALEDDPAFQRAADSLRDEAAFFSFTRLRPALEYFQWANDNWERLLRQQVDQWDFDPAEIDAWVEEERRRRQDDPLATFPPADVLLRHLGDTAADVRPVLDGFQGRLIWLRPQ